MNQLLGEEGEEIASQYLKMLGYEIIKRNFRCRMGEIDIIAIDKDELVFIEVKTRGQQEYGTPGEAVNKQKKNHIYHVAQYYLMINHMEEVFCRIDVVEIYKKTNSFQVNHLKNCVQDKPVNWKMRDENESGNEEIFL